MQLSTTTQNSLFCKWRTVFRSIARTTFKRKALHFYGIFHFAKRAHVEQHMKFALKSAEGVEIKIMYDDIGHHKLPYNFHKTLTQQNFVRRKHNKYTPIISALHNNRDHRKITTIDGFVAYRWH